MNLKFAKIKDNNIVKTIGSILYSKYFPFITAAFSLLCYYLGWDIVFIYYIGIVGLFILLTMDDISPMITILLFMCILVSYKNSPSNLSELSKYYFQPAILIQVFIVIGSLCLAIIYRLVLNCVTKHFSLSPCFFGLCAFAAVLLLNGLFSENYTPKNLVYGLTMAASFLGIFVALKDSIKMDDKGIERVALSFFALSIVLVIELYVTYLTSEELYVDGVFNRAKLIFGWGMWNTMGMMLLICLPAVTYLAGKYKYGFAFTLYSAFLFVATWMSCSRQAMLGSVVIYLVCLIVLLIKGTNRAANLTLIAAALVAITIVLIIFRNTVAVYVKELLSQLIVNKELNGNGRMILWRAGISNFKSSPVFGVGFYIELYKILSFDGYSGMSFIPQMCHNTIVQLLSSCGILGLLTYLIHTVQISQSFMRNVTYNRVFVALTIVSLAGISLVDNHIFNIFPTIIYSILVAVLISSQHEKSNKNQALQKLP